MSARENLLVLPTNPEAKHRLRKALRLIICEESGRDSEALFFLRQPAQSYAHPGVAAPADSMPHTSRDGRGMQTNGVFIPFHRLREAVNFLGMLFNAVMLLALLSGQRCQTLHCLSVSSMKMSDSKCVFTVDVLLKQSRKGKHLAPLEFLAFPQNEKLCIVSVLNEYLRMTKEIRGEENKLLLSYQAPHKPVSRNTLARWLRQVLNGAGVDTAQFSTHSSRAASTSAALSSGVPVDVVLRAAGWSSESTFTRF